MPRPQLRSDQAIIEATRAILLERGPAAPVSAIAQRAGLSAPAILGRYGSRGALVRAALASPSLAPVLAAFQSEPSIHDFPAQLQDVLGVLGRWLQAAIPRQLALRLSPPPQRPRIASAPDEPRLLPSITIWLARAQARGLVVPGDAQALSATLLHTLQGHATARLLDVRADGPELEVVVSELVTLLAVDLA